ncbi:hypothetical protein EVAR_85617_1 [Eumeta japonica]|uniref:Uncharacterized protein n=1 Tax=Eumeta variegata TaxID=151549 RepID=A0A4C1XVJ3_EUMVA|nr:hypothetical protein EVAR_85617_1 [Eumeta japonica]
MEESTKVPPLFSPEMLQEKYCPRHGLSRWYAGRQQAIAGVGKCGDALDEVKSPDEFKGSYCDYRPRRYRRTRSIARTNSNNDSITNSSLKEVKREDLADELTSYVKEIQLRVLQRERDYG